MARLGVLDVERGVRAPVGVGARLVLEIRGLGVRYALRVRGKDRLAVVSRGVPGEHGDGGEVEGRNLVVEVRESRR
eukprot:7381551-Alexandrium_andersonii.AAC.1